MNRVARIHKIVISMVIVLASAAVAAAASTGPAIQTNVACYPLGELVTVTGSGFGPLQPYEVLIDGQQATRASATTDATGAFTTSINPGGLAAGYAQKLHHLSASDDGINFVRTNITVTRPTGAFIFVGRGPARSVRARFEAWGFALKNNNPLPFVPGRHAPPVYVHYLNPGGRLIMTIPIGHAGGQCGFVESASRPLFGFSPGSGRWTLQFDSSFHYSAHPKGPIVKVGLRVG